MQKQHDLELARLWQFYVDDLHKLENENQELQVQLQLATDSYNDLASAFDRIIIQYQKDLIEAEEEIERLEKERHFWLKR